LVKNAVERRKTIPRTPHANPRERAALADSDRESGSANRSGSPAFDALHLATLDFLRRTVVLATYDGHMVAAARSLDFPLFPLEISRGPGVRGTARSPAKKITQTNS
jgi:hypothetical protein